MKYLTTACVAGLFFLAVSENHAQQRQRARAVWVRPVRSASRNSRPGSGAKRQVAPTRNPTRVAQRELEGVRPAQADQRVADKNNGRTVSTPHLEPVAPPQLRRRLAGLGRRDLPVEAAGKGPTLPTRNLRRFVRPDGYRTMLLANQHAAIMLRGDFHGTGPRTATSQRSQSAVSLFGPERPSSEMPPAAKLVAQSEDAGALTPGQAVPPEHTHVELFPGETPYAITDAESLEEMAEELVDQADDALDEGNYRRAEELLIQAEEMFVDPESDIFVKTERVWKKVDDACAEEQAADRKQTAVQMLQEATKLMEDGQFSEAARTALRAKGLDVKYLPDDMTPDAVMRQIVRRAKLDRDAAELPPQPPAEL